MPGWFQATLALYDCAGKRAGLRRRLPLPSRPRAALQGPRRRTVRDRDQGRDLPRPARFRLSHQPWASFRSSRAIFPLGGRAGTATTVKLSGWNLPTDTLTLDAKDMTPGIHPLSVRKGEMISNTMPFLVDTLPECRRTRAERFDANRPGGHAAGDRQRADRPARRLGRVPFRGPRRAADHCRSVRPAARIAAGQRVWNCSTPPAGGWHSTTTTKTSPTACKRTTPIR